MSRNNWRQGREEWEYVSKTAPETAHTKVSEKGVEWGAPGAGAEVPCSLWRRSWWGWCVPAAHGGLWSSSDLGQEPHTLVGMPKGGCDPAESPQCTRLLAGTVGAWRGAHAGAGLLGELETQWGPKLEQHTQQPVRWTPRGEVNGGLAPREGPHGRAGEECEEFSTWGGSSREDM